MKHPFKKSSRCRIHEEQGQLLYYTLNVYPNVCCIYTNRYIIYLRITTRYIKAACETLKQVTISVSLMLIDAPSHQTALHINNKQCLMFTSLFTQPTFVDLNHVRNTFTPTADKMLNILCLSQNVMEQKEIHLK